MSKCDNSHKFGKFKVEENRCFRECRCCGHVQNYPFDKEIFNEISKQSEARVLVDTLIRQDPKLIVTNDDAVNLVSCLVDDMFYVYIDNDEEQEQIVSSINQLNNNEIFLIDEERYNFLSDASKIFSLFFEKERLEVACGLDKFPDLETKKYYEELCNNFDILYDNTQIKSQEILDKIYNQNLKEPSIRR